VSITRVGLRATVLRGVAWNAGYQAVASVIQFAAMLVVVRIVPPEEYGLWAVSIGILQLLNTVNIASFVSQALQLRHGDEPDWTLHWHVGNVLQAGLCVLCAGIGAALHTNEAYQGVSILLYIASVGLLMNTPAQIRVVMLQRRLAFRRMRTIAMVSSIVSASAIVLGAMAGYGARAIVFGGNVLVSLPLLVDLLVVERWRPTGRWFAWPDLCRYRGSLAFGANRAVAALLASSRGALNAAVLPSTLGFGAIGLMNRAEGLFSMSAGRILGLVSETVYPILPQIASEEPRFERVVRGYSLLMSALALAAFALFASSGPDLSRVLYGAKWAAADALLLPGSLIGLGATLATVAGQILLARGRLREVVILELVPRLCVAPAFVGVLAFGWDVVAFHWSVAIPLVLAGLVGIILTSPDFPGRSLPAALAAPAIAACVAWCGATLAGRAAVGASPLFRCSVQIPVFASIWLLTFRGAFPEVLSQILALVPGGAWAARIVHLRAQTAA
jgi:O-antigen/teichoic acid export membrane protein